MPAKKPVAKKPIKTFQSAAKKSPKAAAKKLPAKKTPVKRATAAKAVLKKTPKQSTSTAVAVVKPITLSSQIQAKGAEWELVESKQHELVRDWAKRLNEARYKIQTITQQYKKLMLNFLQEAYAVYREVEDYDFADQFYKNVRWQLHTAEIKVQSNTPDASLLIRYVCGNEFSTKSISEYSRVLEGAKNNNIAADAFVDWVKQKTMTKVIEDQRALENDKETYADRLKRARLVILRLLEAREAYPIISQKSTAWAAQKNLSGDGLWFGIGTALRRNDRESFYADIIMTLILPPNVDLEIYIINHLAKSIVSTVENWEKKIVELEERVWSDELWEKVVSAGNEESVKSNTWWANKQQASRFEDEGEFRDYLKNKQKK
jgi:hypothetical protein